MFDHLSGDLGVFIRLGICRGTFFVSGPQNFQLPIGARFRVQLFNLQILTGFHPVLFSTSFNNCVHVFFQFKSEKPSAPFARGEKENHSSFLGTYIIAYLEQKICSSVFTK